MLKHVSSAIALSYLTCTALTAAQPTTIYVVGDSTAKNGNARGWGTPFAQFFDPSLVKIENRARGGRSSRTFLNEGSWDAVKDNLKPGDFVLIQFGHNDGGPPDQGRARGVLRGVGEDWKDFTMPDGKTERVHTFGWYIRKFVEEAKAKGALPILLSPTVRNIWKDGQVEHELGQYGRWTRQVAEGEHVPFVDLSRIIAERYQTLGPEAVQALFPEDHTHTCEAGADLNASLAVCGLRALEDAPFDRFLSTSGRALAAYKALQP